MLTACSSNQKKGDDMMYAEQYEQAVSFYEKAYQESPDDEEVVAKLTFARSRLVGENLIEVRMFRQFKLHIKAAKKLNESLGQMTRWKIRADSAVKTTIDEEIQFAANWIDKELARLSKQKDYNRFSYSLKQYNHIIDAGYNDKTITKLKPEMITLGQQQCRAMKTELSPSSHYYFDIWQSYCANVKQSIHYSLSKDPSRFTQLVFNTSQLTVNHQIGISKSTYSQTLAQKLAQHPWFSSQAETPLYVDLKGSIKYHMRTTPHTFSFSYPAKNEIYEIIKDKKNPKKTKRKLLKVTPTERTLKVKGQSYIESVSHSLTASGKIHQHKITAAELSAEKRHQTYAHQAQFKKTKTQPLKPKFMNKSQWFSGVGNGLVKEINNDLDKAWVDSFCDGQNNYSLPRYENSARCAVLNPQHAIVKNWSQNQFNLTYEELIILLD